MKYLLFLSLILPSAFARDSDQMLVRSIDNIDYQGNTAKVLLETGETFEIPRDHAAMPCLWNGWMAPQEVILGIDEETGEINECKLYAGGVKHLKNTRKIDY
ncbi:MAG: hypothetical protein ACLGHN_16055 [Bacteriovoracia bacterium]